MSRPPSCAARSATWIIFREILPNALSPLVAEMGLRFIFAVLFVSTLSFLGLGVQPPAVDWGGIVKENKEGIVFGIGAALIPAAAIAALAISVNLVADWVLNRTTRPERRPRWLTHSSTSETCRIEATVYPPGEPPKDIVIVDDVSLTLEKGKVLGLIGESGAGKSTIGLSAMGYGRGGVRITGGEVLVNGRDILKGGVARRAQAARRRGDLCRPIRRRRLQPGQEADGTGDRGRARAWRCQRQRGRGPRRRAVSQAWPAGSRKLSATAIRTRSRAVSCSAA